MSKTERNLEQLLAVVQQMFGDTGGACYEFTIGRIAGRWRFHVVNSWNKWLGRGFQQDFSGDTPAGAVLAFLAYADANKIDVRGLTEAATEAS